MKKLLAALLAWGALCAAAQSVVPPPIAARSFILVDALSGQTLAAAGENDRYDPASLTKIMTSYVVYMALRDHRIRLDQAVTPSVKASTAGGARMFIEPRTPVTVKDLLQGLVVQSGNDAAIALAEAVAGTEENFVALMNKQAQRLGLTNTHFANASGAPAPDHYSSARDLATLTLALIRDFPDHYPLYSEKEFTYNHIRQANRNRLLWTDPSVDGVKTGFTEAAGYCLVASARRGERRLVSVVMGARSDTLRTTESQRLLNFGFQAYDTRRLYKKGEAVAQPVIYKGSEPHVPVGFQHDVWLTLPRGGFEGLKATLVTRQPFLAPIAAGEKAGIMKLVHGTTPVAQYPVVALKDVPVAGFASRTWDSLRLLFTSSK